MQSIARVNRVYKDKPGGLVVITHKSENTFRRHVKPLSLFFKANFNFEFLFSYNKFNRSSARWRIYVNEINSVGPQSVFNLLASCHIFF